MQFGNLHRRTLARRRTLLLLLRRYPPVPIFFDVRLPLVDQLVKVPFVPSGMDVIGNLDHVFNAVGPRQFVQVDQPDLLPHCCPKRFSFRRPQRHLPGPLAPTEILHLLLQLARLLLKRLDLLLQFRRPLLLGVVRAQEFHLPQQIADLNGVRHPILVAGVEVVHRALAPLRGTLGQEIRLFCYVGRGRLREAESLPFPKVDGAGEFLS